MSFSSHAVWTIDTASVVGNNPLVDTTSPVEEVENEDCRLHAAECAQLSDNLNRIAKEQTGHINHLLDARVRT